MIRDMRLVCPAIGILHQCKVLSKHNAPSTYPNTRAVKLNGIPSIKDEPSDQSIPRADEFIEFFRAE
jgi:hypothetical protein